MPLPVIIWQQLSQLQVQLREELDQLAAIEGPLHLDIIIVFFNIFNRIKSSVLDDREKKYNQSNPLNKKNCYLKWKDSRARSSSGSPHTSACVSRGCSPH